MDSLLTEFYNQEALYLHELMDEFSSAHAKIGRRLGMQASAINDPYVQRLIQAFSFVSARMQMRLAAEFPQFTEDLLQTIYPNYTAPTPAISVARLFPDHSEGDLTAGFLVKRGTTFRSKVPEGEKSACQYQSSQDVVLYPLEVVSAHLTGVPPDIPSLNRRISSAAGAVKGALRIRLRTTNGCRVADLQGLERLPFYLTGAESSSSRLFELLHVAAIATVTAEPGQFGAAGAQLHVVDCDAVVHEGMDPDHSVLPLQRARFHGQNLLHEYFACPSRFYFFTLAGLHGAFANLGGSEAEIVVLLSQSAIELAGHVDAGNFALFCTPVVNLFQLRIDSAELVEGSLEVPLRPMPLHPLDYEVFAVERVFGHVEANSEKLEFVPRHHVLHDDEGDHGRYYAVRRGPRVRGNIARRYGTRTSHRASEIYVSLVDRDGLPYPERLDYLSADVLATNGDLPQLLDYDGCDDLEAMHSMPVAQIGLVCRPSAPRSCLAQRETAWKLICQLSLGHALLRPSRAVASSDSLQETLRLFVMPDDTARRAQIDSIVSMHVETVTRKLPCSTNFVLARGARVCLGVDESGFQGTSPYLLGLVLEHYLSRQVSIHSFVQIEMHSVQRGLIARWPVRRGMRSVA
jgi:type VI secretion system protein ImpG